MSETQAEGGTGSAGSAVRLREQGAGVMKQAQARRAERTKGRSRLALLHGAASETGSLSALTCPRRHLSTVQVMSPAGWTSVDRGLPASAAAAAQFYAVERRGGVVEVLWWGRDVLDATNADLFGQWALGVAWPSARVVANLAHVERVDWAGIDALASLRTRLAAAGGGLKLAALTPRVERSLAAARRLNLFSVYPSSDGAVAAFAPVRLVR